MFGRHHVIRAKFALSRVGPYDGVENRETLLRLDPASWRQINLHGNLSGTPYARDGYTGIGDWQSLGAKLH